MHADDLAGRGLGARADRQVLDLQAGGRFTLDGTDVGLVHVLSLCRVTAHMQPHRRRPSWHRPTVVNDSRPIFVSSPWGLLRPPYLKEAAAEPPRPRRAA
ncbi:hypothetical protein KRMM14A1004_25680 [Krasilnikovia sp. MM14-A1004]